MMKSIVVTVLGLSVFTQAEALEPVKKTGQGFTNVNSYVEYEYTNAPGEVVWHENGRAFWKGAEVAKKPQTQVIKTKQASTVKLTDADQDGVIDQADKCPNTPALTQVNQFGCEINKDVTINLDVKFPFGKTAVSENYIGDLETLAKVMKENPTLKVEIQGHTDSIGSDTVNQFVSEKRAISIKDFLASKLGVSTERLSAKGFGETSPVASNKTKAGRKLNRRVQAKIITSN